MSQDHREQILAAAHGLFLEHGYRAGVDAIAAAAGVSKQTIYNHFGSKEALFGAVVSACSQTLTVPLSEPLADGQLREALVQFARAFRQLLLRPQGIALHRMLIAETARFPEAASQVFSAGPALIHRQLSAALARAIEREELRREQPEFAAGLLLSMLIGFDRDRLLYGLPPHTDEESRPERIVDLFLRGFAPEARPHSAKE